MKKIKLLTGAILILLLFSATYPVNAQDVVSLTLIEQKHNDIEQLYAKVYDILDKYPDVKYSYEFDNGMIKDVHIEGIPNQMDKIELQSSLLKLEGLKSEIINQVNGSGIYYVTEKEPEPKMGYGDFYEQLQSKLTYPEVAEENGVEGTVIVKFIVDSDGNVNHVMTTDHIKSPFNMAISEMEKEARKAVQSTSGEWIPAKVGDVPVDQWVTIPVQFNLENEFYSLNNF